LVLTKSWVDPALNWYLEKSGEGKQEGCAKELKQVKQEGFFLKLGAYFTPAKKSNIVLNTVLLLDFGCQRYGSDCKVAEESSAVLLGFRH